MQKKDIINVLKELNYPTSEYWVVTGAAMVMYDIKVETKDIDLGCTKAFADELENQGFPVVILDDGLRKITISDNIEIFENWIFDKVECIDQLPVISIDGLIEMKKSLGRLKDLKDLELISEFKMTKKHHM